MEKPFEMLQVITDNPGYLFKIQQIMESGCLNTISDVVEIHFDERNNIRRIRKPDNFYPKK